MSIATSPAPISESARASDSDSAKRRVWLAIGLMSLAALTVARLPVRTFTELARGSSREQAVDHERLRHLNQLLPAPLPQTGGPVPWFWSIAAVVLPCWGAHAIICALSRALPPTPQVRGLRLALAVGTGLGLSSVTYFLWLLTFGQPQKMFLFADASFWCLVVFVFSSGDRQSQSAFRNILPARDLERSPAPFSRPLACLFATICIIALAGVAGQALASPKGGWDAQAIWNLRARFLFRAGDNWRGAFAADFDHTDYPLLVPAALARFWTFLGSDPAWPGACLGIVFTIATVALLVAAVGTERRWSLGLLAGMVLLGTVRMLRWGALQYADVPLAFFFLATMWLLTHHDERCSVHDRKASTGLLTLAGLMVGLAAWTKNEGLFFAVVVLVVHSALRAIQIGWKPAWRECRHLLAGALPLVLVLVLFKTKVSSVNDLMASQGMAETTRRLLDPIRHLTILKSFVSGGFQVANAFAVVVPLCFVLLGRRRDSGRRGAIVISIVMGLMLAAYYCAYLTTPYELQWHLSTSVDRLLIQLWPSAVLAIFRLIRSPEEAWPAASRGPPIQTFPVSNAPHVFGTVLHGAMLCAREGEPNH